MDAELKSLKKYIKMMRSEGILHLKTEKLELTLSPASILPEEKPIYQEATSDKPEDRITEEEVLFWSAPTQTVIGA